MEEILDLTYLLKLGCHFYMACSIGDNTQNQVPRSLPLTCNAHAQSLLGHNHRRVLHLAATARLPRCITSTLAVHQCLLTMAMTQANYHT
jgi:hypothetical protein